MDAASAGSLGLVKMLSVTHSLPSGHNAVSALSDFGRDTFEESV